MKRGFTLLELLIVIAILAVLATVVIITLDPAEIMRKTRDVQRISDLSNLKTAIQMYLIDYATDTLPWATSATSSTSTSPNTPTNNWLGINFTLMPSGSPLSRIPIDPVNNETYQYRFQSSSTVSKIDFEIDAKFESKYYTTGDTRLDNKDAGDNDTRYETGTALTIMTRISDWFIGFLK